MAEEITNLMILQHMQIMKGDLLRQMKDMRLDIGILRHDITRLREDCLHEFTKIHHELADSRLHREALEEDLNATILMVGKHHRKLARIKG